MSETFSGKLEQGPNGKGTYKRNGQTCDAEVVYVRETADGVKFALIKKDNSPWDKVEESYSICWEMPSGKRYKRYKRYLLGLPVDPQDIDKLKAIL